MSSKNTTKYEEMNEAEEEDLLKSDDELEAARAKVPPPPAAPFAEEDSLMAEAGALEDQTNVEEGISEDDENNDEENEDNEDNVEENDESSDNDSDEDSDENDVECEEKKKKAVRKFNRLASVIGKGSYVECVKLCDVSIKTRNLEYIRKANDIFTSIHPVLPGVWIRYLNSEEKFAKTAKDDVLTEALYRKALRDYYSIEIAKKFAAFAPNCVDPELIWQELLSIYGLHCFEGRDLFISYRKYLETSSKMSPDEQQDCYIQSYLRELRYPLLNMEDSYIEFKVFYEKNKSKITRELDWEHIDKQYFIAKEHLTLIEPYEERLVALGSECDERHLAVYKQYICLTDYLDEDVMQTLYERWVASCNTDETCWLHYIAYIEDRDQYDRPSELPALPIFQQSGDDLVIRAMRCVPWSQKLYIMRMRSLVKQEKSRKEIQNMLERALACNFNNPATELEIWIEYLSYLGRNTDWANEAECKMLRTNFELAWTSMAKKWGEIADMNCQLLQFWGRLEYGPLQDPKRGKELWEIAMDSYYNRNKATLWMEFLQLELRVDLESTRELFRKAYLNKSLDDNIALSEAWYRFELCNGTVETIEACKYEIEQYETEDCIHRSNVFRESPKSQGTKRKSKTEPEATQKKQKKVSPKKNIHEQTAFREHAKQEIDLSKDHLRVFLSNLDYSLTEEQIVNVLPELCIKEINLIRTANGKSRGFAYLELANKGEVETALTLDKRSINGRPLYISSVLRDKEVRQNFKYSDGLEPKKLFVKSLPSDVTKPEVEQIFGAFGKLTDVRLVYHKSGKFKNIAYVEFEDEKAATRALMGVDQMKLRDHTISVAISAPPPKPNTSGVAYSKVRGQHQNRNKVFDKKPRMSMIPNVVRKLNAVGGSAAMPPPAAAAATPAPSNGTAPSTKTNEDFRKLLQK